MTVNKIFKIVLVIVVIQSYLLVNSAFIRALDYDLNITGLSYEINGNLIEGNCILKNNLDATYKDLFLRTSVCYVASDNNVNIINQEMSEIIVPQKSTRKIDFKHKIPDSALAGKYYIIVDIVNRVGVEISKKLDIFTLKKDTQDFLLFDAVTAVIETKEGDVVSLSGPNFKAGEKPKFKIKVENPGTSPITAKLRAIVYQREITFNPSPLYDAILTTISFAPEEAKEIVVELPSMNDPDSYYTVLKFETTTGEAISGIIEARYVVEGISAKIIFYNISINDGKLNVDAEVVGPADNTKLNAVTVATTATNLEDNKEVLRKEETIDLGQNIKTLNFSGDISKEITDFKVKIETLYEGKVLDSVEKTYTKNEVQIDKNSTNFFIDIADYKFKDSINYLAGKGLLKGYPDGTFKPLEGITRAETSTLVCYILGKEKDAMYKIISVNPFVDIDGSHWAKAFISYLKNLNIIKGYPDSTFKPQKTVTYAEAITIVTKIVNEGNEISGKPEWYDGYLEKAKELGLTGDFEVKPTAGITRGDFAQMMYKVVTNYKK